MGSEGNLLQVMRAQVRAVLPERAFLRRDRGDCLLITNAPAFDSAFDGIPGFICFRRGTLACLLPDESWIERCERARPADFLSETLLRFRGQKPDGEGLRLFAAGAKLLDGGAAPAELAAYDQNLRRRAALALRGGCCGGGLYSSALLNAQLKKGEKQL